MAIDLSTKTNVDAPDTDYPYGKIRDNSGTDDGTPVDVQVYGDFHQFFARMFAKSGLTYNGLPDNNYSGFQYFDAASKLWKSFIGVKLISVTTTLTIDDIGKLIVVSGTSGSIDVFLPKSTDSEDGDSFTIINFSNYDFLLRRQTPDAIWHEGSGSITLTVPLKGDFVLAVLDKGNTDWYIANYKISTAKGSFSNITPNTNWTVPGTYITSPNVFQYRKNEQTNEIEFRGFVKNTDTGVTPTIMTLPVGSRPVNDKAFVVWASGAPSGSVYQVELIVFANGSVNAYVQGLANNTVICLDTVRFSLD